MEVKFNFLFPDLFNLEIMFASLYKRLVSRLQTTQTEFSTM